MLVGVTQLGVAVPSLFGHGVGMVISAHAAHEAAAWNVALGAAFVTMAARPRRASAVLPAVGVFVGVLAALSVEDLADGAVAVGRLASHLDIVAGLVLGYALARLEASVPPDRLARSDRDERRGSGRGGLRGVA